MYITPLVNGVALSSMTMGMGALTAMYGVYSYPKYNEKHLLILGIILFALGLTNQFKDLFNLGPAVAFMAGSVLAIHFLRQKSREDIKIQREIAYSDGYFGASDDAKWRKTVKITPVTNSTLKNSLYLMTTLINLTLIILVCIKQYGGHLGALENPTAFSATLLGVGALNLTVETLRARTLDRDKRNRWEQIALSLLLIAVAILGLSNHLTLNQAISLSASGMFLNGLIGLIYWLRSDDKFAQEASRAREEGHKLGLEKGLEDFKWFKQAGVSGNPRHI